MGTEAEIIVGGGLTLVSPGENESRGTSSDLWCQISVARSFPRSLDLFARKVVQDVCATPELANECTYLVRRGQDDIEGPSIRFAESLVRAWGNVRISTEVVDDNGTNITARARFWDLETNMAFSEDFHRRVTTKEGKRYGEDMITTTKNAAQAIAFRNVVLAGIPKNAWWPLYLKTVEVTKNALTNKSGNNKADAAFEARRAKLINWFLKQGATELELAGFLGCVPIDAPEADIVRLERLGKSVHEGHQTVAEAFNRREEMDERPAQRTKGKQASQKTEQQPERDEASQVAPDETESGNEQESTAWTPAELSKRFSKEDPAKQSSAIVLSIEALALGDITADQMQKLAVEHCGHEGDVAGSLLLNLLSAGTSDSASTAAQAIHAAKAQKTIGEDLHKALSGFVARRMRELKGRK